MKVDQVKKAFLNIQLDLTDHQCQQFVDYYELLISWNDKINLTSITQPDEVITKHFVDSVLASKVINFNQYTTLVDIGTGAGFPGIPLKIVFPHLEVTLIDALNKRIHFLDEVIDALGLEKMSTHHGRAEELARTDMRDFFDVSVSRAVSQLNVLCEYCLPYIRVGGIFVSYKGAKTLDELASSKNAIDLLGGRVEEVTDTVSLDEEVNRGFVCIRKIEPTNERYPRRVGKPLKKPL